MQVCGRALLAQTLHYTKKQRRNEVNYARNVSLLL